MAKNESALPSTEVRGQQTDGDVAPTKRFSTGVILEVPDGVTEIAVEGQRFPVEAGIVEIPYALGDTARAHVDSLFAAARLKVARLERELSSDARSALRKAWKIVRDTIEREIGEAP